jgi:hypothetical protein
MSRYLKIRIVLVILSLGLPVLLWGKANPPQSVSVGASTVSSATPDQPPPPETDQTTNIPYFTLRDGMSSTLTLNNVAPKSMKVSVTLFNMAGRAQKLDSITLEPHSFKRIELRDVAGEEFDSGNIEVAYFGTAMAVTCQVSVSSVSKRVSFESREQGMMDFASSNLNGIVAPAQRGAEAFLALTSVAEKNVTVQLAIGSKKKVMTLTPRETQLLKLNEDSDARQERGKDNESAPVATLVSLQHNGLPGAIITTGFVWNLNTGYSSSFTMHDPRMDYSSTLAGVHFRFGQADPIEGFPSDTQFRAPLLLANVSAAPVNTQVSVDYTIAEKPAMTPVDPKKDVTQDKFTTVAVMDLTVPAGAVRRIELADELAKLGVPTPVKEAGVDIKYDAAPGAIMAQLTSIDQTGDYSFEVPIKDAAAANETMVGNYPWTIEDGTESVLHLKNTTADSVSAFMTLLFPGGESYYLDPLVFKPYQSVAIDIQKIKESGKKDRVGRLFPKDAVSGQVQWRQDIPYSIIGRAEETNVKLGIARSFSCPVICCWNANQTYTLTSASSFDEPMGTAITVTATGQQTDCNGVVYAPVDATPARGFSSDYPSIVSLSAGPDADDTTVNFVGSGSSYVRGNALGPYKNYSLTNTCRCQYRYAYMDIAELMTSRPPDHTVVGDDTTTPRQGCAGFVADRKVHFLVLDQPGRQVTASVPVQEQFLSWTPNTCPSGLLPKQNGCVSTIQGNYTDEIANDCTSHDSTCGYTLSDEWQWCPGPGSFSVNITHLNDIVQGTAVTVNGNTTKLNGTYIYP